MLEAKNFVPQCKFAAATAAAIEACDTIDAVKDGVLEDPRRCVYDPKALVGTEPSGCGPITEADAAVIRRIWEGPEAKGRIVSLVWAPSRSGLRAQCHRRDAADRPAVRHHARLVPLLPHAEPAVGLDDADARVVPSSCGTSPWSSSARSLARTTRTSRAFRDRGGKLILWHGWADPLIYAEGTIDYYTSVQQQMGGRKNRRLHPAVHGAGRGPLRRRHGSCTPDIHSTRCSRGSSRAARRRRWAPSAATRAARCGSRPLCQYPLVARYKGQGSTDEASSFECRASF